MCIQLYRLAHLARVRDSAVSSCLRGDSQPSPSPLFGLPRRRFARDRGYARRGGRSLRKVATARDAAHVPARALAPPHEPRNLPSGRAQSHISFGPVTEKNVEQVGSPWPRPQWPACRDAHLRVMPHAAMHRASPCSCSTQQRPSCYPGARTGEEAQPRGIPGEVSQLARSARAARRHAL